MEIHQLIHEQDLLVPPSNNPTRSMLVENVRGVFSAVQAKTATIAVLVKRCEEDCAAFTEELFQLEVTCADKKIRLLDLSAEIASVVGIQRNLQTIFCLTSPMVQQYEMRTLCDNDAHRVEFAASVAFRVIENDNASTLPHLRPGRRLSEMNSRHTQGASAQDELRQHLTQILTDTTKRVCLIHISRMTGRSKSSLSLWRRGCYPGTGNFVARAVAEALDVLRENDFVYNPAIHDGCLKRAESP